MTFNADDSIPPDYHLIPTHVSARCCWQLMSHVWRPSLDNAQHHTHTAAACLPHDRLAAQIIVLNCRNWGDWPALLGACSVGGPHEASLACRQLRMSQSVSQLTSLLHRTMMDTTCVLEATGLCWCVCSFFELVSAGVCAPVLTIVLTMRLWPLNISLRCENWQP